MKPRQIAAGVAVCGLAGLIYLASQPLKRSGQTWNCQSNLKQIGLGMMQYVRDYDEHFPRGANWMEGLRPYAVSSKNSVDSAIFQQLFRCPATNGYYALNVYYAQISAAQDKSPQSSPLVFDVVSGRLNQSDGGQSWPAPPVHTTLRTIGTNVLFGDGHVELRQNKPRFRAFTKPKSNPAKTAKS